MRQKNYHRRKGCGEREGTLRQGSTKKSCLRFFFFPPPTSTLEKLQIYSCNLRIQLKEMSVKIISIQDESILTYSETLALP